MSNFPASVDSFGTKQDLVTRINAADVNDLQSAVVAIETELKTPSGTHPLGYMPLAGADTITGVKTFSAKPIFTVGCTIGTGDNLDLVTANTTSGQLLQGLVGTAASPDRTLHPALKLSRTIKILDGDAFGASSDPAASTLLVQTLVDVNSDRQGIGISSYAFTNSTAAPGSGKSADGVALFGLGWAQGASTHIGTGAYLEGGRAVDTARGLGAEIRHTNLTGTAGVYNTTQFSGTGGLWITAGGTAASASAIQLGRVSSQSWKVGYGITSGSVTDSGYQDDSSATYSLLVNGTHTSAAMAVASGAGPILIGETTRTAGAASSLLEVNTGSTLLDPMVNFVAGTTTSMSVRLANGNGSSKWCIVGGAGNFMTGSGVGDTLYQVSANSYHIGSNTQKVITVNSSGQLGFFAKAAVGQQSTTGTSTGFTAGGGTTVTDASTFTGGTGATAYRLSDIVLALKNYGLMAA